MNKLKQIYYGIRLKLLNNQIERNTRLRAFYSNIGDAKEYFPSRKKVSQLETKKNNLVNKLSLS